MTSPTPLGDGTPTPPHDPVPTGGRPGGLLDTIERVGNRLPDPAALFLILLFVVWKVGDQGLHHGHDLVGCITRELFTLLLIT